MNRKYSVRFSSILCILMLLAMLVASILPAYAQSSDPANVTIKLYLLAKGNGEVEVNHFMHWSETASRAYIDIICDCKASDIGYANLYQNDNWDASQNMRAEDLGDISQVFHRVRLNFPYTTTAGSVYQAEIGYGSYQDVWYSGYDAKGLAIFAWTYNPWPFPVTYDVHWMAKSMQAQDVTSDNVVLSGNWDSYEQETPHESFGAGFGLHMIHMAPANEALVVSLNVPGQYFGKNAYSAPAPANDTAPDSQPSQNNTPYDQSEQPQQGGSAAGALGVICIIGLSMMIGGGILFYVSNRKPKSSFDLEDTPAPEPQYRKPVVKREGRRTSIPLGVATDLTMAQAATIMGASDEKIVLAAVQDLKKRDLITIVSEDPLKLAKRPRKVATADEAGELTSVDNAVLLAIFDGTINAAEQDTIVAAVKASLETKMDNGNNRTATKDFYEERIRTLEQQVRSQSNPTRYVQQNNDVWFWLWLSDRYDHDKTPRSGTYAYPSPDRSVYVSPAGRVPVSNDSFSQSVADFEKPRTGIASEITDAAKRATDQITGAATGHGRIEVKLPHDACYVRPHDACVARPVHDKAAPHDACVAHDKHDNCVSHDNCVRHDNCVSHSNCHTHSACVSHSAGGGGPH